MVQSTKNNQDLLKILVSIAWIDGEIQPEEQEFLEQIATEQNLESTTELQALLAEHQDSSLEKCYQLLEQYLGSNPDPVDYDNLLSAVSKLIYSDDDIATEEASLLTKIQNLDPNNSQTRSTLDKAMQRGHAAQAFVGGHMRASPLSHKRLHQEAIAKIQKLYQKGLKKGFASS